MRRETSTGVVNASKNSKITKAIFLMPKERLKTKDNDFVQVYKIVDMCEHGYESIGVFICRK